MKRIIPRKRLTLTQACKQWDKERKKIRERKYENIGGVNYEYPCYKKGHTHTIDCCTVEMWDACSELAYANAK